METGQHREQLGGLLILMENKSFSAAGGKTFEGRMQCKMIWTNQIDLICFKFLVKYSLQLTNKAQETRALVV